VSSCSSVSSASAKASSSVRWSWSSSRAASWTAPIRRSTSSSMRWRRVSELTQPALRARRSCAHVGQDRYPLRLLMHRAQLGRHPHVRPHARRSPGARLPAASASANATTTTRRRMLSMRSSADGRRDASLDERGQHSRETGSAACSPQTGSMCRGCGGSQGMASVKSLLRFAQAEV
jgi:hypothetical protein